MDGLLGAAGLGVSSGHHGSPPTPQHRRSRVCHVICPLLFKPCVLSQRLAFTALEIPRGLASVICAVTATLISGAEERPRAQGGHRSSISVGFRPLINDGADLITDNGIDSLEIISVGPGAL